MLRRRHMMGGVASGLLGPAWGSWAQQTVIDVPLAATTDPTAPQGDSLGDIHDKIDAYLEQSGLLAPPAQVSVLQGVGTVLVRSDHPQWVHHRTMAFEEALLTAQQNYIGSQQFGSTSEAILSLYKAANMEPPPYDEGALGDPSKVGELLRKAYAVGGGAMDKALEALGINPKSLEKAPADQKHVQLQRALAISGAERAFGTLAGMVTRRTLEAHDGNGNYQIGVVAVVSPKLQALAQSVQKLRGEFLPDLSKVSDWRKIAADSTALVDMFGVRLMYDLAGLPVLVSFGQWGIERTGSKNAALVAEFENTAMRQAEIRAGQQLAEFLSASGDLEAKTEFSKQLESIAARHADGYIEQKDITARIKDPVREALTRRARVTSLTGIMTLRRWKKQHPDLSQQIVYGAIRYWSAAGEAAIRSQKDGRTELAPAGAAPPRGPAGTRMSKEIGNF